MDEEASMKQVETGLHGKTEQPQTEPKEQRDDKENLKKQQQTYMNKERKRGLISVKETENTLD